MPNNSSARREKDKDKKKKDKKRETVPPPLHKEDKASKLDNASSKDKASSDSSSLSLFLLQALAEHQRLRYRVMRVSIRSMMLIHSGVISS